MAGIVNKQGMKINEKKMTQWIINLPSNKTFWVFGLLIPMYVIWLRYIGLFTIDKNGRRNKVFNILSAFLVVGVFVFFIIGFGIQIAGYKFPDWAHLILPLPILTVWFACIGITGKNMVDYENRDNEYFYGVRRLRDYVYRFCHLCYFPLSIYWLQMNVNTYMNCKQEDSTKVLKAI